MDNSKNIQRNKRERKRSKRKQTTNVWIKPKYIIPIALSFFLIILIVSTASGFYTGSVEKQISTTATVQSQLIDVYFIKNETVAVISNEGPTK